MGVAAEAIETLFSGKPDAEWPELSFAGAYLFAEFFAVVRGMTKPR